MGNPGDEERNQRDRDRAAAKRRRFIRSAHEPLIPFFCRLLFVCMIVAPVLDLIMEFARKAAGNVSSSDAGFAVVVSWSALVIWCFFAVFVLILSGVQLIRMARFGYEEKKYLFEDEIPAGTEPGRYKRVDQPEIDGNKTPELILYAGKPDYDPGKRYRFYAAAAAGGAAVLALVYFICTRFAA